MFARALFIAFEERSATHFCWLNPISINFKLEIEMNEYLNLM